MVSRCVPSSLLPFERSASCRWTFNISWNWKKRINLDYCWTSGMPRLNHNCVTIKLDTGKMVGCQFFLLATQQNRWFITWSLKKKRARKAKEIGSEEFISIVTSPLNCRVSAASDLSGDDLLQNFYDGPNNCSALQWHDEKWRHSTCSTAPFRLYALRKQVKPQCQCLKILRKRGWTTTYLGSMLVWDPVYHKSSCTNNHHHQHQ